MGLGIIEPRRNGQVPGTVSILEKDTGLHELGDLPSSATKLKYRDGFLLVPQPSDDPNDPLNWPLWKRDSILCVLCLMAVVATTTSPILAATSFSLLSVFGVQFTSVALLTGYHLLGVGIGGIFFVPSARVWGKRHLYILGTFIIIVTCVWGGVAAKQRHYRSFFWSRIFQGIGLAPFEALINASVGDLFFVHERGKRMALTTVCLFGSAYFCPVIVGVIATNMGLDWTFYWVAILCGILAPLVVFFVPETAFVRSAKLNNDFGDGKNIEKHVISGTHITHVHGHSNSSTKTPLQFKTETSTVFDSVAPSEEGRTPSPIPIPQKTPYSRTLLPFNGRKTDESYIKLFFRPFPLFLQPGVVWAAITQGVMIGWTVFIGIVLSAIFQLPPLYFTEKQVGYLFASALVGAVVGFLVCGASADPLAKWMTRKNGGIYEPEFRVPLVIFQLIFGCTGLYGFALTGSNLEKYSWPAPDVFFGFVIAGMVCGAVSAGSYLVDAHREIAIEAFTCVMIFKNIFSFALTFHGYDWLQQSGTRTVFVAIGSVQVALCVASVGMYCFGKVNRGFWARHDILALFRLR